MPDGRTDRESESSLEARRFHALLELAALDKADFDPALRRILSTDADLLDVGRVNCWEFVVQPKGIRCVAGYIRHRGEFEAGGVVHARTCPSYFEALARNPVILANEARTDPRTRELTGGYLEPLGITSVMDVPVWVRGALWGVVCHEQVGPPRNWTQAEVHFATSIGHIVSMAVEARERAQAERMLRGSEFLVGLLSHDLRSPLTAIQGSASSLRRSSDEGVARAAALIMRGSERMMRMIEQLLDLTRIRVGGGMPITPAPTDLEHLCRHAVDDAEAAHPDRGIALRVAGDAAGEWDPDRVSQVLANLISNALEHGEAGAPVWVRLDGTAWDRVVLDVGNRGAIPASAVPSLFDPFSRRRAEQRRSAGGLGLGLFIAREIVNAHGGSLTVDVRADETVFRVELPRCRLSD